MRIALCIAALAGVASSAMASSNVLVWSTGNTAGNTAGVAAYLAASGQFDSVTGINSNTALTAAELAPYDRVLYFSNTSDSQDPTAVGDALADYADTGRRLVLGVFSWANQGNNTLGGRIIADQISPFVLSGSTLYTPANLGATDGSAFWTGVNSLNAGFRDKVTLTAGSTLRGSWEDGVAAVATKGNVVGVNMFPDLVFGFYSGDAQQLFVNALTAEIPAPGTASLMAFGLIAAGRRRR